MRNQEREVEQYRTSEWCCGAVVQQLQNLKRKTNETKMEQNGNHQSNQPVKDWK